MYLAYFRYGTVAKNKLEDDFSNYLKEIDRTLVPDQEIEDFKQEILDDYARLCAKHNRCKPMEKHYHEMNQDFILHGSNSEFKLLKSK